MTNLNKAKAISKKIKPHFPVSPEGQLMYSIVACALVDSTIECTDKDINKLSTNETNKRKAIAYLKSNMIHCELSGVSSEWVHRLINKAQLGFLV